MMDAVETDCTENCRREVTCRTCTKTKAPYGRDVAAAAGGSRCTVDCPGYFNDPRPGHLWPGEAFPARTWTAVSK